jgi:hypothetical protein
MNGRAMKSFKQILSEAKKNKESQENIEGGDMSKPYKIPDDIRNLMTKYAADDSTEWSNRHSSEDQGIRRGAESIEQEEEELTPARQAELAHSQEILKNTEGSGINMDPSFTTGRSDGNLYSNNDIARILNARGVKTVRGKEWSHQLVDLVAQNALEKIKKGIIR